MTPRWRRGRKDRNDLKGCKDERLRGRCFFVLWVRLYRSARPQRLYEEGRTKTMDHRKIAGAELSRLRSLGVLPEAFEGLRVASKGTPIYDLNGEELFRRIPLSRQRQTSEAFVDIATHPA